MSARRIGIIMHGVTGRMGMNQHLIRSILAIRKQGGVALRFFLFAALCRTDAGGQERREARGAGESRTG